MSRSRVIRTSHDPERFGRWSERVARRIGSAQFIAWMTVLVLAWVLWNTVGPQGLRFDAFPFDILTLLLSLQASYAAALILLAQYRHADRDRVQYQADRDLTNRLMADTEYLTREIASVRIATGELVTRDFLRGEIRDLAEELSSHIADLRREQPSRPEGSGADAG
ncbi:MAG: DUF1003 domain-containing protein [Candidatus Nanopelagicales bacterium]